MGRNRLRSRVSDARAGQMYVLAGLPPAIHTRAVAKLKERFPIAQVVGLPSSAQDGPLYPQRYCEGLARSATEFAVRKRQSSAPSALSPLFIMLLYVPSEDSERLLKIFDFTVMPVPLTALQVRDDKGTQLRHLENNVDAAISEAVSRSGAAQSGINLVIERLKRLADNEVLLLPPINFHTEDGRLASQFMEFRNGARTWSDRVPELAAVELKHDDIARIPEQKTRRAYVDARRLAYLMAHQTAFHGSTWEIEEEAGSGARVKMLRALYRFGGPLESGMHHDAQRNDGSRLVRCEFDCDVDGRVAVTASHANVYPTDYVRAEVKQKI